MSKEPQHTDTSDSGSAALKFITIQEILTTKGKTTRRGVADALDVPAAEGIAVSQAIEGVIGVGRGADPSLEDTFEVEIRDRAIEQTPYQQSDE